jgi:protein-tyrosine-phosphatase
MKQTTILIIGGAATGRVPMTTALLGRLLAQRGLTWEVRAAGVVAHDDSPAEVEARDAMLALGLNVGAYRAHSLTDEMVAAATLLLAVDSGTARVIYARYPDAAGRTLTLGELAGRPRDIPDPFRMQVGAWITYAREIESLLRAGLTRLIERAGSDAAPPVASDAAPPPSVRAAALARCDRALADAAAGRPWDEVRGALDAALVETSAETLAPGDLALPYVALLRALLSMTTSPPTAGQAAFLSQAIGRLRAPVDQQAITALSAQMGVWASL